MDRETYCDFIDKICADVGLFDPEAMYEMCTLKIGLTTFQIFWGGVPLWGGEEVPDKAVVVANFGQPPADLKLPILERLMEINLLAIGEKPVHFALEPSSGNVMATQCLPFMKMTSDDFKNALLGIAYLGDMWRKDYFFDANRKEIEQEKLPQLSELPS